MCIQTVVRNLVAIAVDRCRERTISARGKTSGITIAPGKTSGITIAPQPMPKQYMTKQYIYAGSTTNGREFWMELDPSTTAAKTVEFARRIKY